MHDERPFKCMLCNRRFQWLHNYSESRCLTCDTTFDLVTHAIAASSRLRAEACDLRPDRSTPDDLDSDDPDDARYWRERMQSRRAIERDDYEEMSQFYFAYDSD